MGVTGLRNSSSCFISCRPFRTDQYWRTRLTKNERQKRIATGDIYSPTSSRLKRELCGALAGAVELYLLIPLSELLLSPFQRTRARKISGPRFHSAIIKILLTGAPGSGTFSQ